MLFQLGCSSRSYSITCLSLSPLRLQYSYAVDRQLNQRCYSIVVQWRRRFFLMPKPDLPQEGSSNCWKTLAGTPACLFSIYKFKTFENWKTSDSHLPSSIEFTPPWLLTILPLHYKIVPYHTSSSPWQRSCSPTPSVVSLYCSHSFFRAMAFSSRDGRPPRLLPE